MYSQLRGPARSSSSEDEGLPGITLLQTSSAGGSASVVGSPYSGHYGGGKVTRRWVLEHMISEPAALEQSPDASSGCL